MRRSLVKLGGLVLALTCTSVAAGAVTAPSSNAVRGKQLAATTLTGDGSTFQLNYTQAVISGFKQLQPLVTVKYEGIGSTRGLDDFANQRVDFAGTDTPFTPEAAAAAKGGTFFYFPTVVAPLNVSYNIPGVSNLQLSPDTIAWIFQGLIKTWDSSLIKQENPTLSLPNIPIIVAHRADGSGTTQNFTRFLTEAAPATWALGTGATIHWPVDSQGGAGDVGVAQIVKTTVGAIGYVDYSDAHALGLSDRVDQERRWQLRGAVVGIGRCGARRRAGESRSDLRSDQFGRPGCVSDHYSDMARRLSMSGRSAKRPRPSRRCCRFAYSAGQQLADGIGYVPLAPRRAERQGADQGHR